MSDAITMESTTGHMVEAHPAGPSAQTPVRETPLAEEPRVLDTYSLFYAFTLVLLIPGVLSLQSLPFRTYTFAYVSLVTVPFLLGLAATILTDSADALRTKLVRFAVLSPIVMMTGVGVLFTSSIALVPASRWITPENFGWLTWVSIALLALLVAPLPVALWRRFVQRPFTATAAVQALFLVAALVMVGAALYATTQGVLTRDLARKDIVIYIIGAMTWYLPAFGVAAGVWRRTGLV